MSLLSCQNLCISFAQRDILINATFDIAKGDKIGLIGSNGCGKTTLLKAISGVLEPSDGKVIKASATSIGFVEQHACQGSELSVYDELLTVFSRLCEIEKELEEVNRKIDMTDGKVSQYIELQAALTEEYQNKGGLTYKNRAHSCLMGLGFTAEEEKLPVASLSGGQRTKLSLGKLLLSEPDLMLLDEPTNHLDIKSVEWLEDFIGKFTGTLIIVSHDRYFLDKTTSRTLEITGRKLCQGKGGYSVYMKTKELRLETEKREYEKAQIEIKRIEKMIEQQKQFNQERNYITIASKEKQIERIKASMPELPPCEKTVKLRFSECVRAGDEVLIADNLTKSYDGKTLFSGVGMKIFRGEKVFILGPNGCGKTTLLGLIMNKIPKDDGLSRFGHNVNVGYFEQTQKALMSEKTVLQELYDRFPTKTVPELRGYLGAFNFRNDDIEKLMKDLSGGERARVALLILILKKPNFLILDEPTNHLDFASREVLEEALSEYDGTVLCVSHDRYFVNRIATKIMYFDGEKVTAYEGNYDDYINIISQKTETECEKAPKKINDYKLRKELESQERKRKTRLSKLETAIEEVQSEIDMINEQLSLPENAGDFEKVMELTAKLNELNASMEEMENEWLELSE
ncbi:MAG: ABC-F family ATP-binding cassette domain-containing protein [Ruminococcaceae bacterium]|nr:ABC-F family ATP-binding cassette domain-containing protein [Oscillospiraceae bacterium]